MAAVNLASFQSPGVYVRETDSGIKTIAGVSTSTAGFIGIFTQIGKKTANVDEQLLGDGNKTEFELKNPYVVTTAGSYRVLVDDNDKTLTATLECDASSGKSKLKFTGNPVYKPAKGQKINVKYDYAVTIHVVENLGQMAEQVDAENTFALKQSVPGKNEILNLLVYVDEKLETINPSDIDYNKSTHQVFFKLKSTEATKGKTVRASYSYYPPEIPEDTPVLCSNFTEFKNIFFDYSVDSDKNHLAHAVSGFFANGGSRCYVICSTDLDKALEKFENVDEIAMVAAPGKTDQATQNALIGHCLTEYGDLYRIAILDGVNASSPSIEGIKKCNNSNYAALYYPWIKVSDPKNPKKTLDIPPSGHIAGIYARVDNDRGVHKAPANESVRGAIGVSVPLSKIQQANLNPVGINCIRLLNNNILVWGARTVGGDANQDMKYINVRRTLLFLRKSIEQNTQWIVFEPNTPALWQKITRNITAFLTTVWRSGPLFGNTAEEAFYVKCDKEINTSEVIESGVVVTEIGVAIARPAEFVVFQISQWAGPG